jgi:hypothetical protein
VMTHINVMTGNELWSKLFADAYSSYRDRGTVMESIGTVLLPSREHFAHEASINIGLDAQVSHLSRSVVTLGRNASRSHTETHWTSRAGVGLRCGI